MYVQLFLGIMMLLNGIGHYFKVHFLLRKSLINRMNKDELASFQRGMVLPSLLLGMTFIVMGFVEKSELLPLPVFLGIYILIAVISLAMIYINSKKHTG